MSNRLADSCLIVVIDMHKGHIGPEATIPAPDAEVQQLVPRMESFLEGARDLSIPIVHVRYEAVNGIHNAHPAWDARWADKHCVVGSSTTELVVKPQHDDFLIESKRTYNCFAHTDLELYLKRLGRDTVVILGIATDCCCLATAFGAADLHYKVISILDCQVGMTIETSNAALAIVQAMLGQVMTSGEFLERAADTAGAQAA